LTEEEAALVQRFDPVDSETIGFFVAKFVKVGTLPAAAGAASHAGGGSAAGAPAAAPQPVAGS
jgi:hypothetical protein